MWIPSYTDLKLLFNSPFKLVGPCLPNGREWPYARSEEREVLPRKAALFVDTMSFVYIWRERAVPPH